MHTKIDKKTDTTIQYILKKVSISQKVQLLNRVESQLKNSQKTLVIFTPNPEQIMLSQRDGVFASYLGKADILIPDGIGLVWASRLYSLLRLAKPIPSRITGVEFAMDSIAVAQAQGKKVVLVGGRGYHGKTLSVGNIVMKVQEATKESISLGKNLKQTLWWISGYSQVSRPQPDEEYALVQVIQQLKPDIVMACFGAPAQEKWVLEHLELLEANKVGVALVVGGAFDMLLGKVRRAPLLLQKLGLEWFFRLIQEPWRFRRQLQLFSFVWLVVSRGLVLRLRNTQEP